MGYLHLVNGGERFCRVVGLRQAEAVRDAREAWKEDLRQRHPGKIHAGRYTCEKMKPENGDPWKKRFRTWKSSFSAEPLVDYML